MSIAKQTSGPLATDLVGEEEVSKILSQALGRRDVSKCGNGRLEYMAAGTRCGKNLLEFKLEMAMQQCSHRVLAMLVAEHNVGNALLRNPCSLELTPIDPKPHAAKDHCTTCKPPGFKSPFPTRLKQPSNFLS